MQETLIEVGATIFVLACLGLSFGLIVVGIVQMCKERRQRNRRVLEHAVNEMYLVAEQRWEEYEEESSEGVE